MSNKANTSNRHKDGKVSVFGSKRQANAEKKSLVSNNAILPAAQSAGNLEIQYMLQSTAIQPQLIINSPDDPFEQEANRVADQVMRMPAGELPNISTTLNTVQRKCAACASGGAPCPNCAKEEQPVQRKEDGGQASDVAPGVASQIKSMEGGGQPLSASARSFFEPRFGKDFSDVRVHTDNQAANSARAINARAYTYGQNMVFGPGQYSPSSSNGRHLLAHELTHVVQQGQRQEVNTGQSKIIQRKTDSLAKTSMYIKKDQPGPVTSREDSSFSLEIDQPAPRKYFYFRWIVRDQDKGMYQSSYIMRSTTTDESVLHFGTSKQTYIDTPQLQEMYYRLSHKCTVYCRVYESDSANPPSRPHSKPEDSVLLQTHFVFRPDWQGQVTTAFHQDAWQSVQDFVWWEYEVQKRYLRDFSNQSSTIGKEREKLDLALTSQRAAAIDAAASGKGWLAEALQKQGYSGPGLTELKLLWAEALVAAELLKIGAKQGTITSDARLTGLQAIPFFYSALNKLIFAIEVERKKQAEAEDERLQRVHYSQLGDWYYYEPLSMGEDIAAANTRVYEAESKDDWEAVANDVNFLGDEFVTLIVESLPGNSEIRTGIDYLESLDFRLSGFEGNNPLAVRIPAVFYPKDRTISPREKSDDVQLIPESIPWQFYLINTGVKSHEQPARSGGEWVLIDLTSNKRFENRVPASDQDSARFQKGEDIDPPNSLFKKLNSRIRFPKGLLYFKLPSGQMFWLETTEPRELSDWLSAIGLALAAIAILAAVVATGGAAAPAAVAFYSGLGAAAAGAGATLASLHEKREQGSLTSSDVDNAMISIGIDVVSALSLGLGRLVAAPATAARLGLTGKRFIALQQITQTTRAGVLTGDIYQVYSLTNNLISAFKAIENQPGLTDDERNRLRGQLVRRALISGALLTIAIRGDIQDLRAGGVVRVSDVDADGTAIVVRAGADAPGASSAAHAAPHAKVTGPVHADSRRIGTNITIGPQHHALAVTGTGRMRDFYFCSDRCAPIAEILKTVVSVLPRNHPFRYAIQEMLKGARNASKRLKRGQLTQEEADAVARRLLDRISRLSKDSQHFAALMNSNPAWLAKHRHAIRQRLGDLIRDKRPHLGSQHLRQAANRGRDPFTETKSRSPIETDILGGIAIQEVDKPGKKLQQLHFDVGNFSHTYAEALIPDLPRNLTKEAPVTLLDGTVGRADRVRFVYDADGDRIGARVFEIKPNTPENIARGKEQVKAYVAGFKAKIEAELRAAGKEVPSKAPDGKPLYSGQVVPYNYEEMDAVLRALRENRRDAARMAEYEEIARKIFSKEQKQ